MAGKRASAIRARSAISDQLSSAKKRKRSAGKSVSAPKKSRKASPGKRSASAGKRSGGAWRMSSEKKKGPRSAGKKSSTKKSSAKKSTKKSSAKKRSSSKERKSKTVLGAFKGLKEKGVVKLSPDLEITIAEELSLSFGGIDKKDALLTITGQPIFRLTPREHAGLVEHLGGKSRGVIALHWPKLGVYALKVPVPTGDGFYYLAGTEKSGADVVGQMVSVLSANDFLILKDAGKLIPNVGIGNMIHSGDRHVTGSSNGVVTTTKRILLDTRRGPSEL